LGIVLVLGANLGGGLIAVLLSRGMPPEAWAVPLTNLGLRGLASIVALTVVTTVSLPLDLLGSSDGTRIMHAHILFNLALAILALPFAGRAYAFVLTMLLVHRPVRSELQAVSALDQAVLDRPKLALANVTREIVGLCETIETMLCMVMELFSEPDAERIEALIARDTQIVRRHHDIKLYLSRIEIAELSPSEAPRVDELLSASVRLEQVSGIITHNLLAHIKHKEARGLSFSDQGWHELNDLHATLIENARLAFNVVVTRDSETALQTVKAKDSFRDSERRANVLHFERLREGGACSIDTSSLHMSIIRDLKQINALLAGLAYPVLEQGGLLLDSRIRSSSLCPA
jgi:phosphate:Na+ symporter